MDDINIDDYAQNILEMANTQRSSTALSVLSNHTTHVIPRMSLYLSDLNRHDPQNPYNEERVYALMKNVLRSIATSNVSLDHELPRTAITDMVRKTRAKRASREQREECARVIANLHSAF